MSDLTAGTRPEGAGPYTYLSMDSLDEGVGDSQVLAYVRRLSAKGIPVVLHSFEKRSPRPDLQKELAELGVEWRPHDFGSAGARGGGLRVLRAGLAARGAFFLHARSDPAAGAALLARPVRWVWDMRSFWLDQRIALGHVDPGSIEARVLRAIERRAARSASAIVVLARAARLELQERHSDIDVLGKTYVIPTCVDLDRFTPSTHRGDRQRPLAGLLSGTLNSYYDVPLTVRFIREMRRSEPVEITVATPGSTPWDALLDGQDYARTAATPDQMPDLVAVSDFGLSICRLDAGVSLKGSMPTKIAEFLASGRPIVVNTGLGDMDELLQDETCGVVVRSAEEDELSRAAERLVEILHDPRTPERCRRLAQQHFNLDDAVDRLAAIYGADATKSVR